jgi:hypothetical protein
LLQVFNSRNRKYERYFATSTGLLPCCLLQSSALLTSRHSFLIATGTIGTMLLTDAICFIFLVAAGAQNFSFPIAKVTYSRSQGIPYAVYINIGTPGQNVLAAVDTSAQDIVLSSAYEASQMEYDDASLTFDESLSSTWELHSDPWGSDIISFEGSNLSYNDVLFGHRDSTNIPSILGLGKPHFYSGGLQSIWDVLQSKGISRSFSLGLSSAPEDFPGSDDTPSQDGWLVFGAVARAYYDSLSTVPLLEGSDVAFTLTATGVIVNESSTVSTVSNIKYKAQIRSFSRYPAMPKQLTENIASTLGSSLGTDSDGLYLVECDVLTSLMLNFQGQIIRIPGSEVTKTNDDGTCSLAIIPKEDVKDTFTISGGFLSYIYFVVNYKNSEISLGEAKFPGNDVDPDFKYLEDSIPGATSAKYYEASWSVQASEAALRTATSETSSATFNTITSFSSVDVSSVTSSYSVESPSRTPYLNSTAAESPSISGDFSSGELRWKIVIPTSLGPWSAVDIDAEGCGYSINAVSKNGVDVSAQASINGGNFKYSSEESLDSSSFKIVYTAGRITLDALMTSNVIVSITRPNRKREILLFSLSFTINTTRNTVIAQEQSPISTVTSTAFSTTLDTVESCYVQTCSRSSTSISIVTLSTTYLTPQSSLSSFSLSPQTTPTQTSATQSVSIPHSVSPVATSILTFSGAGYAQVSNILLLIPMAFLL